MFVKNAGLINSISHSVNVINSINSRDIVKTSLIAIACIIATISIIAALAVASGVVPGATTHVIRETPISKPLFKNYNYKAEALLASNLEKVVYARTHRIKLFEYLLKLAQEAISHGYAAPKLVLVLDVDSPGPHVAHARAERVYVFGTFYTTRKLGPKARGFEIRMHVPKNVLLLVERKVTAIREVFTRVLKSEVSVRPLVYSGRLLYVEVTLPAKLKLSKETIVSLAKELSNIRGLVGFAPDYKVYIPEMSLKSFKSYVKSLFEKLRVLAKINLSKRLPKLPVNKSSFVSMPILEPGKTYPFLGKYPVTLKDVEEFIDAEPLYKSGVNGSGVIIYILDTGVAYDHPSLQGKVITCASFVPNEPTCYDYNGHGTWVAGIAAGRGVNSEGFFSWWDGVIKYYNISASEMNGVAYGAYIGAVKVLSKYGWGYLDWVIKGIYFAVQDCINKTLNGTVKACVISMSLGAYPWTLPDFDPMYYATYDAMMNGVVVVAAIGNEGPGHFSVSTPGYLPTVIGVGAVYLTGLPTFFTSRGPVPYDLYMKPDVAAPGAAILGPWNEWYDNIYYLEGWGTSAATPVVSGSVALLLSLWAKYSSVPLIYYGPNVTYAVLAALVKTARMPKVSEEYSMYYLDPAAYGAGIIDVAAAAKALLSAVKNGLVITAVMPPKIEWDTPPTVTLFPGDWKLLAVRVITTVPMDKVALVIVNGKSIAEWVVPKPEPDIGLPLPVYMGYDILVPVIIRWKSVYTLGSVCDPTLLSNVLPAMYGMCYLRIVLPPRPVRLPRMYIEVVDKDTGKVLAVAPIDLKMRMPRGIVIAADIPASMWPEAVGLGLVYQSLYGGEINYYFYYSQPIPGYFAAWAIAAEHGIRIIPLSDLVYRLSVGHAVFGLWQVYGMPVDPWYVLATYACRMRGRVGIWFLNTPVGGAEGFGIRALDVVDHCHWVFLTGISLSWYGIWPYPGYELSSHVYIDPSPPWPMEVMTTSIDRTSPITRDVYLVWMPCATPLAVKPPAQAVVYGSDVGDWYMYTAPVIAVDRTGWHSGLVVALDPYAFSLGTSAPDLVWLWAFYIYSWTIPVPRAYDNIRLFTNIMYHIAG